MKKTIPLCMIMIITGGLFSQETSPLYKVISLSAEHVFLEGGTAEGVDVGDTLIVKDQETPVAVLKVVFVAEHSASCIILRQRENVQVGQLTAKYKKNGLEQLPASLNETALSGEARSAEATGGLPSSGAPFARVSGSASLQLYVQDDSGESELDFFQPTWRLNLRLRQLWGKDFAFRIRTRTRYSQRTASYGRDIPREEWRNRIYELSLSYDNHRAPVNFRIGRFLSNYMSGIGYIDGVQIQHNLSRSFQWGIFAGSQPGLRSSEFQSGLRKYGAYLHLAHGEMSRSRLETTVAAAGEYHSTMVSREFFHIRNSWSQGSRLYIYQSADIDVNRQWRREKSGERFSLSNLYLSGRYRFFDWLAGGLTFDNRKNYWTYEILSRADSLFDEALRLGLRGNLSLRLPGRLLIFASAGFRKQENEQRPTYSFAGGLNKTNLILRRLGISVNYAGFSNEFTRGFNTAARLSNAFPGGQHIDIGYGIYSYQLAVINERRKNQWLLAGGSWLLWFKAFLGLQYEYHWGSDLSGNRILAEIGYRF